MATTNAQILAAVNAGREEVRALSALLSARLAVTADVAAPVAATPTATVTPEAGICFAHPEHGKFSVNGMAYHRTWCTGTVDDKGKAITVKAS